MEMRVGESERRVREMEMRVREIERRVRENGLESAGIMRKTGGERKIVW